MPEAVPGLPGGVSGAGLGRRRRAGRAEGGGAEGQWGGLGLWGAPWAAFVWGFGCSGGSSGELCGVWALEGASCSEQRSQSPDH